MDPPNLTESNRSYLYGVPWIRKVVDFERYIARPLSWDLVRPDPNSEPLFGRVLNSPSTIPHCCFLYADPEEITGSNSRIERLFALVDLGPDLAGHPGVCHGGVISALFDEVMGTLAVVHRTPIGSDQPVGPSVTASITVDFKQPVTVPGQVVIRAVVVRSEGRKYFIWADMMSQPADGEAASKISAKAKALFIELRNSDSTT